MTSTLLTKGAVAFVMCVALAQGIVSVAAQRATDETKMPAFEVDAAWPRLPNNWVMGQTPGIAVDCELPSSAGGGVAATSKRSSKASFDGADGVVWSRIPGPHHPVCTN